MKKREMPDEVAVALFRWKNALKRFDLAEKDEAAFTALEAEAAKRRYICLLNRERKRAT
ncbi:MAG: hypothetical protein IJM20_06675 [Clostridia bacterium]|jgi:hypothetical protein|nr:hypothetical protein [Clostridia bacterium]